MEAESLLSETRVRLVDETSHALQQAIELEAVLSVALRAVVPRLADLAVLILDYSADGPRLEVAHSRPNSEARVRREVAQTMGAICQAARRSAREGHHFRWMPSITTTTARLMMTRGDQELAALLDSLDVRSVIVVALRAGGRTLGGLALARTETDDPYHGSDLAMAQVLARRTALAVESAVLRESLRGELEHRSTVGEAFHKWIRVFDLAWWGAALVDGLDRRIDTVNPAFARLHGFADPASLAGRLFSELLPADRAGEPETWGSAPMGAYETVHLRSDGTEIPVLVSATLLDEGQPAGSYVVTVQDLTDLKRTEERLRRAQRMEAVGRLAGGVAHEVNNMMTIILGFSDLLSREPEEGGRWHREVEEIRRAALRAAKITTQLLAFSRQQVLQPTDLRLNRVVGEMVPVLRLMLPANVRIETDLAPRDAIVRADRSQLEQVLINLAFNARDAMASGGTIRISTRSRRLDEDAGRRLIGIPIPRDRYGLLSVVDTGHGMDQSTLAQVFEPFFTTKPVGLGTGLGLSTVYGIVKQSGGYVWVESVPGQGTSFTICLPQVSSSAGEAVDQEEELPVALGGEGTVVVLEDEDGVRELAARVLGDRGYCVMQARNGGEALALLSDQGQRADLLLTDVIVPDMGTGELEQSVNAMRPELPILYMSGYPRDDILHRGLLRADQPFLQKPFTSEDLAAGVASVIGRS